MTCDQFPVSGMEFSTRCRDRLHVPEMNSKMPKIILKYRPNGRRRLGRSLKRLFDEAERGLLRRDPLRMMMMTIM